MTAAREPDPTPDEDLQVRALIRELLQEHPRWSDEDVALAVVNKPKTKHELAGLVRPLVAHYTGDVRRALTRKTERRAFGLVQASDPALERKKLLEQGFFVPGKGLVTWGEATVEDHLDRITYLERLKGSIDETIDQHRQAISEIKQAGVRCLYEVEGGAE